MGIKDYLDFCLAKYYQNLLDKYEFTLTDTQFSNMSGLYSFKNDYFEFMIVNDRGIIETRIKPVYSKNDFWDFDVLNVLVKKLNGEFDSSNKTLIRNYLTKRLNLEEEIELFDRNYDLIIDLFNKNKFKQTQKALNIIGKERAEYLFGKH